jgi:hypothetical protein
MELMGEINKKGKKDIYISLLGSNKKRIENIWFNATTVGLERNDGAVKNTLGVRGLLRWQYTQPIRSDKIQ